MLEVDMPSFLRPASRSSKPPDEERDDDDAGAAWNRILTGALAGGSNLLVAAIVSLLGPFYPPYALSQVKGATNVTIGLVFAFYPLAQIITAPVSSALCHRHGRLNTALIGLALVSAGCGLLFGVGGGIGWHMAARLVQGAGGGCVNVAAFALVMEASEATGSLTRDMGVQEVLIGVGYMVGPAIGGALFPSLGLQGMMRLLSLLPMFMAITFLTALAPRGIGRKRRHFLPSLNHHDTNTIGNGGSGTFDHDTLAGLSDGVRFLPRRNPWWADFTVLLAALALVGDAAALGFMDPTLALHLQQLLGLGVRKIGLLFSVPPLVYSTVALLVQPLSDRVGHKHTVAMGLLLVGIAFLAMGPVPCFGPWEGRAAADGGAAVPVPLSLLWALILCSLALAGLGSALIVVPACPLLLDRLETQRPMEDFKDRVSALYTVAWSVGDALGPFLGGLLTQLLPATPELRCFPPPPAGHITKEATPTCTSSFRWSSAVFGIVLLLLWAAFLLLVPPDVFPSSLEPSEPLEDSGGKARAIEGERARLLQPSQPPPSSPTQQHSHRGGEGGGVMGAVGQYHSISHRGAL